MLYVLKECTGASGDDHGRCRYGELFLEDCVALCQIVRIYHAYALKAHGLAECLEVDLTCGVALDVVTGGGVLLMARHAGDGVVQNDHGGVALVVSNVCKTGHAGMHEGGVADDCHGLALALLAQCLIKAVEGADGCAHAKRHFHGA